MMNQKEIDLIKKGGANLLYKGEVYECVGEQKPLGLVFANNSENFTKQESELMSDPEAEISFMLSSRQYNGIVHKRDFENKELLKNSEFAVALLQIRPDIPEKRDISFEGYESACKNLGEGKKPTNDMYWTAYVEPTNEETLSKIGNNNSQDYYTNIGNYMFAKMNDPRSLPNMLDGYYGTSASISNVVLIKEKNEYTALYVERFGFKLLEDFMPDKQALTKEEQKTAKAANKLKSVIERE